ncbi:MAG: GNAT family N-acetyltransferase [Burkholderiales bacterium]|jgi:GNAT superfamily N-acetyltransferase|nr:GNAT family N-acetyltransferase [Burkholderiales bacterium]
MPFHYTIDRAITVDQFIALLLKTSLAARRPLHNRSRVEIMLKHANLLGTAWDDDRLIGVARAVTDFAYCCYLSDLAVDETYQRHGIGKALIALLQKQLHSEARIVLLAAPLAVDYYPHIGFERHSSAWTARADQVLR